MPSKYQSETNNIFLIGMMGSWKSTVGRYLAKKLDMNFIDTDDEIEKLLGMKISDIFKYLGEDKFRQQETDYLRKISKQSNHIISTGGGIVGRKENREIISVSGVTILLQAEPLTLSKRIRNTVKRPLLDRSNNILLELESIWQKRQKDYESTAHLIIKTDSIQPEDIVEQIIYYLKNDDENH